MKEKSPKLQMQQSSNFSDMPWISLPLSFLSVVFVNLLKNADNAVERKTRIADDDDAENAVAMHGICSHKMTTKDLFFCSQNPLYPVNLSDDSSSSTPRVFFGDFLNRPVLLFKDLF